MAYRVGVPRQLRSTYGVVQALDREIPFADVDAVINLLWWDETTTVLPDDPDGHGPFGSRRIVDDDHLTRILRTLEAVKAHLDATLAAERAMNMTERLDQPRLHRAVDDAVGRVRAMLEDPEDEDEDDDD